MALMLKESKLARFLLSGGLNTAITYALYLMLLNWASYKTSYTVAYLVGIAIAYLSNRFFVFKSHQGIRSILIMPIIYLGQYLISMMVIWVWVEHLMLDERAAPAIAISLTIPATYILSKIFFTKPGHINGGGTPPHH